MGHFSQRTREARRAHGPREARRAHGPREASTPPVYVPREASTPLYMPPYTLGRCTSLSPCILSLPVHLRTRPTCTPSVDNKTTFSPEVEEERVLPEERDSSHPENKPLPCQKGLC